MIRLAKASAVFLLGLGCLAAAPLVSSTFFGGDMAFADQRDVGHAKRDKGKQDANKQVAGNQVGGTATADKRDPGHAKRDKGQQDAGRVSQGN
ncbi:hypothetical protein G5V57_04550 [Nordella sp. HKS 07]|uniref:hypothetical protein n=1 Tax=Nordella sp. HKS 07 TaxID=2712222 RepID=UPI0013E1A43D|nr:hypothetical protein [Nordella sp. HKS 07]QIG46270.1 hypothetical protein G5V57_04550 [Nordella sp. HKS 07]